mmetsp:Transcript_50464/g.117804  ORF Transcript_50464/g.117804 Transcript_50464/m.117804 type:complete len:287 (+) Transcript_50464:180-1040(+)
MQQLLNDPRLHHRCRQGEQPSAEHPGTNSFASALSADLACCLSRTTVSFKSCLMLHSCSMRMRSLLMPLTAEILSPGDTARSTEQLPAHCRFQASTAPPDRTFSTTKSEPSCSNNKPSSVPSAFRKAKLKVESPAPRGCKMGSAAGKEPDKDSAKDKGVLGCAVAGLDGAPSASARESGAGTAGNGNAGTSGSFCAAAMLSLCRLLPPCGLLWPVMLPGLIPNGEKTSDAESCLNPKHGSESVGVSGTAVLLLPRVLLKLFPLRNGPGASIAANAWPSTANLVAKP